MQPYPSPAAQSKLLIAMLPGRASAVFTYVRTLSVLVASNIVFAAAQPLCKTAAWLLVTLFQVSICAH